MPWVSILKRQRLVHQRKRPSGTVAVTLSRQALELASLGQLLEARAETQMERDTRALSAWNF